MRRLLGEARTFDAKGTRRKPSPHVPIPRREMEQFGPPDLAKRYASLERWALPSQETCGELPVKPKGVKILSPKGSKL